jgi:electron transfer flavoprotein beta subunit
VNVVVCVKLVPDPNTPGQLDPETHRLRRDLADAVLDPGDEFGVEAGLRLVEAHGGAVTVVSMGPERAVDAVRKALAMGAAKGVLVCDDGLPGADALTTAKVLAAAIRREPHDLVITATESADGYSGIVPQALAELLGMPAVTFASEISSDGTLLTATRQTERGSETVVTALPCVVAVTAGVNEPRYPTLRGIMGVKSKPLERLSATDLGLGALGQPPAGQTVVSVTMARQREAGEVVRDEGDGARRIVELLARVRVI